jgi:excisionase family DNA binding protein
MPLRQGDGMVSEAEVQRRAEQRVASLTLGLTVNEAAAALGVNRKTIYDAIERGEIEVERMGRRLIIKAQPLLKKFGASG